MNPDIEQLIYWGLGVWVVLLVGFTLYLALDK